MRYIDADALKEHIEVVSYKNEWYETEIDEFVSVENIDSAPSIDIVRCAECKYEPICNHSVQHTTHEPTSVTIGYKSVDFCSYGERRNP